MSCEQPGRMSFPEPQPASPALQPPRVSIGARLREHLERKATPFVCVDIAQAST